MKQDASIGLVGQELEPPWFERFRAIENSREAVLIICSVLLVVLFTITALVSGLYHKKVQSLANQWFSKGEAAFRNGDAILAITDYRNALVYSSNSTVFQLHLAQALAAAGHLDEAESYFTNLLAESPGNGEINLELARIAARKQKNTEAMRYYQGAIYGVWDSDPLQRRWNVRRELCEYLLSLGDVSAVQPEIIALAQEVPSGDLQRQRIVGELLLRATLWDRAFAEFSSVLKFNPRDEDALAGAGTALFHLERYSEARSYFSKLSPGRKANPKIADMLDRASAVVSADPWAQGLSPADRAQRTSDALKAATSRVEDCAHQHGESASQNQPLPDLQSLRANSAKMTRDWSELNLARHPERIDAAMSLVFQMEDAAAKQCGEPQSGPDYTLRIIERHREGAGP